MKYTFNEVSIRGVRKWKDPVTGKPRQETKKFYQTINPWNTTKDGNPKSREQIMAEIMAERDSWMNDKDLARRTLDSE